MSNVNFKGNPVEVAGNFLKKGDKAKSFTLVDEALSEVSLDDFKGYKILSTVPSLDTDVCLISTKKFNEEAKKNKDLSILVISKDLPFAQKRVCGKESIKDVKILSCFRNENFCKDYGIFLNSGPLKGLCARSVIVLDKDNTVIYSELVSEITQEPDYEAALRSISH